MNGIAVKLDGERVVGQQRYRDGQVVAGGLASPLLRPELAEPAYRGGAHFRDRYGREFDPQEVSPDGPFLDGVPFTGLVLDEFDVDRACEALCTYDEHSRGVELWMGWYEGFGYEGSATDDSVDWTYRSRYVWHRNGRLMSYEHGRLSSQRETLRWCEVALEEDGSLRTLSYTNDTDPAESGLGRKFERYGTFEGAETLRGGNLSRQYLSIRGRGVTGEVLSVLCEMAAGRQTETIDCDPNVKAETEAVVAFLTAVAGREVTLYLIDRDYAERGREIGKRLVRARPDLMLSLRERGD